MISVPPNKGCEVLDGKLTHEWDRNDREDFAVGNDIRILLEWGGGNIRMLWWVKNFKMCNMIPPLQ